MSAVTPTSRKPKSSRVLSVAFVTLVVLGLAFCGLVYKAKTQHDLNRQLLAAVGRNDNVEALAALANGADPNIRNLPDEPMSLWQQIQYAFHQGSQASAEYPTLLRMAVKPSDENPVVDTGNVELVKTLLEAGARPDAADDKQVTPLMTAAENGRIEMAQLLLDHGANPQARDNSGRLPIHHLSNDEKTAELLVKHGTDVNAVDNAGKTALMYCIDGEGSNPALVRFLLTHGTSVNLKAKDGTTALSLAATYGDNAIQSLLEHGAAVDAIDNAGDTPLTACVTDYDAENVPAIVKVLIEHGANVDYRNKAGETALSLAKKHSYKETIRLLKAAGAKR